MKWRNFGPGRNQLRLCVVIVETEIDGIKEQRSFLCSSYIKDDKREKAEMAKMKTKMSLMHLSELKIKPKRILQKFLRKPIKQMTAER